MQYTLTERDLLLWLLRNEIMRCKAQINRIDVDEMWKKRYQMRLECAKSALEKTASAEFTDPESGAWVGPQ